MKKVIDTVILAFVVGFLPGLVLRAQEPPQSAAAAITVKALLEQLKMESIATRDPEEPGRYIAALYIQDSQLLVVSAPYTVSAALDRLIAAGSYTDAYVSLQAVQDHPVTGLETGKDDTLAIEMIPKGSGSENNSWLRMAVPAEGVDAVKTFVVDCVLDAGGKTCPPTIVGVGVGGTADLCVHLAKVAATRSTD
jgi:hypothetical protein